MDKVRINKTTVAAITSNHVLNTTGPYAGFEWIGRWIVTVNGRFEYSSRVYLDCINYVSDLFDTLNKD